MKTYAVIGANLGDEGKGSIVDYYAHQLQGDCVVVRFNGGAQAGHTVVTPEGKRHVFSHFGAGSLAGAATYLSSHFVVHPTNFKNELAVLYGLNVAPKIFVDHKCLVTTPYDVLANQLLEQHRGTYKYGSCGIGFNETIQRNKHSAEYGLTVGDLVRMFEENDGDSTIKSQLYHIRTYIRQRLAMAGVILLRDTQELFRSEALLDDYLANCRDFLNNVTVHDLMCLRGRQLVFEGAQGLSLDRNHPWFPYVTNSHTGLRNVLSILHEMGWGQGDQLEVTYVTRWYLTRHGRGPLPFETKEPPSSTFEDLTNKTNPHQEHLRFAPLNIDLLRGAVQRDLLHQTLIEIDPGFALTCLDQMTAALPVRLIQNNSYVTWLSPRVALKEILKVRFTSHGPTRDMIGFMFG